MIITPAKCRLILNPLNGWTSPGHGDQSEPYRMQGFVDSHSSFTCTIHVQMCILFSFFQILGESCPIFMTRHNIVESIGYAVICINCGCFVYSHMKIPTIFIFFFNICSFFKYLSYVFFDWFMLCKYIYSVFSFLFLQQSNFVHERRFC